MLGYRLFKKKIQKFQKFKKWENPKFLWKYNIFSTFFLGGGRIFFEKSTMCMKIGTVITILELPSCRVQK